MDVSLSSFEPHTLLKHHTGLYTTFLFLLAFKQIKTCLNGTVFGQ